ncbi:MAG: DUF177 domain-containing protein [Methylacidiphilales bacterium]|nr:DUF177 domain-containing protein [Candidatus Methylacidiphilales bacterium]
MNFAPALISEEHPLEIREELPGAMLGLNEGSARTPEPIRVELLVQRDEGDILVTGWTTTTLSLVCGRCAEWMPWPVRAKAEHIFEAPHPNSIDLTPFIREDILLELPLNAVCRLGADGRCPVTGEFHQPRPESSDSLVREEVWEALSKIKPKN